MKFSLNTFLLLFLLSLPSAAQTLRGVVIDPSGAVIAGARVTLSANGKSQSVVSNRRGEFSFASSSGSGVITAEAKGFGAAEKQVSSAIDFVELRLPLLPLNEEVVVTPQRSSVPLTQTDAAVVRFPSEALAAFGPASLDEKLRYVPGFSLLRRTPSRAANPTTQGASMRGVAASGASRVLVLDDGVPLNDPFGGWVYWDRVPAESIGSVEVMEGGGSHLYGSSALAGVVNVLQRSERDWFSADFNQGNEASPSGSFLASKGFGPWTMSASAEGFRTDGYVAVLPPDRGAVDTPLTVRYATGGMRLERQVPGNGIAFGSFNLFNEGRGNGTPEQTNSTRLAELRGGFDMNAGSGRLTLRGYGTAQTYSQTFTSIEPDRSSETLRSLQRVPAQQIGGDAQWTGIAGSKNDLVLGASVREIRGVSNETRFLPSGAVAGSAGGKQILGGAFISDAIHFRRFTVNGGLRLDVWNNRSLTSSMERTGTAVSPHLGVIVPFRAGFTWTSSVYRSFRAPTLNELYRNFRVGNILTMANGELRPERLTGGESAIGFARARVRVRAGYFWAEVTDPVANTTLSVTPELITRQRQNLGRLRSRGIEVSIESRITDRISVTGAYQFADSTVLSAPQNPALVGNHVPQVPRQSGSMGITYTSPQWTLGAQARTTGRQFEDDQNLLPLDSMFDLGMFVSRRIRQDIELYFAADNVLDERWMVGRTPTTVWGPPVLFRGGIRLRVGTR